MHEEPQSEQGGGPQPERRTERRTHRPTVTVPSLLGAAAGILLLGSLSGFLSELSGERLRVGGLGLSLMFEALGVVLLVLGQGRRSSTAGVTLAALGVIPLVFFVFFDTRNQTTLVGGDDVALSATLALLVAAGLWLAGHLFGPSRSHALFLGAALVAVWLAITIQVVDNGDQPRQRFEPINRPSLRFSSTSPAAPDWSATPATAFDDEMERRLDEFEKYDNGEVTCDDGFLVEGDPTFWECEGDLPFPIPVGVDDEFQFEDDFGTDDDFGPIGPDIGEDFSYDDDFGFQDPYDDGFGSDGGPVDLLFPYGSGWSGAAGRFGSVTLAFGLLYLAGGALFDRAGDTRRGTAFFAVASPLSYLGIFTSDLDEPWLFGLLLLLVGGAAAWLGSANDRRFTAWFGTVGAAIGLAIMVIDIVGGDSSGTTIGFALLVVGLAVAAAAHLLDAGRDDTGPGRPGPARPGDPSGDLALPVPAPPPATSGGPPLVPPPASSWQPPPGALDAPTTHVPASDQAWAPAPPNPGAPGMVPGPAFDPRPPGSADPLPGDGSSAAPDHPPA